MVNRSTDISEMMRGRRKLYAIDLDVVVLDFLGIAVGSVSNNPLVAVGVGDNVRPRFFRRCLACVWLIANS